MLAPLHQPKSLAALDAVSARRCRPCRRSPASTRPSTPRCRPPRRPTRSRASGASATACAATASTGCRTRTPRRAAAGARRVVTCHLGAGASLCAVLDGRSVDTTMGFTPLEGLVMATRSGSVDPGLLLWLQQHEGVSVDPMAEALEHESGLLGLAGTADMRELLRARRRRGAAGVRRLRPPPAVGHRRDGGVARRARRARVHRRRRRELRTDPRARMRGPGPPGDRRSGRAACVCSSYTRARTSRSLRQARELLGAQRLEHL